MRCYDFYGSDGRGGTLLPVFLPYRMSTFTTSSDQSFVNIHSDLNSIYISNDTAQEATTNPPVHHEDATSIGATQLEISLNT